MSLLRTARTVRYLRPVQVVDRVTRRFRSVHAAAAKAGGGHRLVERRPVRPLASRARNVSDRGFVFLSRERPFAGDDRWWPAGASMLWTYQLHYFQTLFDLEETRAAALIEDWIERNPPGTAPGWDPYPISLRIREWTEWMLAYGADLPIHRSQKIVDSIAAQASVLERFLERHLLGNHLLENAISLCWAGASIREAPAASWLQQGAQLLEALLDEQVLDDGVHDERSPMYQASIAEALLRLADILDQREISVRHADLARRQGQRLIHSLAKLTHPDGEHALLNDCALRESPTLAELVAATKPLPQSRDGLFSLPVAGYQGWRGPDGGYLVMDAGPLGPPHQPGHGHADLLSFELSHRGARLITDTGVGRYAPGPERSYDRSTAAHSTIEIAGRSQSELWAAFRCARRARVTQAGRSGRDTLVGAYVDPWGASHERRIQFTKQGLAGTDLVRVPGATSAALRFHLAPGVVASADGGRVVIKRDGAAVARLRGADLEFEVESTPYHPAFGLDIERPCLVARIPVAREASIAWNLELL